MRTSSYLASDESSATAVSTRGGQHYVLFTDPFVKGVPDGDVDDWAALLAMFGNMKKNTFL